MGDNTLEAHVMIKKEGPRPVSERLRKGLEERAVMDKERATKEYGRELADLINETIARFQARRPSHKRVDAGARNGRLALSVPKQRKETSAIAERSKGGDALAVILSEKAIPAALAPKVKAALHVTEPEVPPKKEPYEPLEDAMSSTTNQTWRTST